VVQAFGGDLKKRPPVKDIVFDQTKRRTLDPTFLDNYMK